MVKTVKTDLKIFPWQAAVLDGLRNEWKGKIHVVKAKRQCGKSVLISFILLMAAIEKKNSVSICLSPKLEQAGKVYEAVKNTLITSKLYKRHNDNSRMLWLINGSQILFKSAEQKDTLRGNTVTGIYCIDEAAFIPDDIYYMTMPWINVSQAPIIMVSSPDYKTGFFYNYYTHGLSGDDGYDNVEVYNWCDFDTSDLLSLETLERLRKTTPASKFKTEYLGEFLDSEGGVFGDYSQVLENEIEPYEYCYFGIDWGSGQGQDETAIAIFSNKKQMIGLYHFSDKDATQTIDYIIELMKKYQPRRCQVETNSLGQVFFDSLRFNIKNNRLPVQLNGFTTTNESKERIINNFQVAIQNNEVKILNDETLKIQMDVYECKVNNNAKHIYNAKQGYHDDCVIATLLAYDCLTRKMGVIR